MNSNCKQRCLVVDDNYNFGQMLEIALADSYEISYAHDAFTAQQMLSQNNFDIILSDVNMPFLDGLAFAKVLRKRLIKTPLIFMTGDVTPEVSTQALELGAANILQKPFQLKELKDKIATAIQLGGSENQESSDQELGYIYNLLKSHYYDTQEIIYQIQYYQIPLEVVREELDKKQRMGRCHLDDPSRIRFLAQQAV